MDNAGKRPPSLADVRTNALLPTGTVWTQLPVGSGRIRTAAVVLRASSREAALCFQPNFSSVMGLAGEEDVFVSYLVVPHEQPWASVLCRDGGVGPLVLCTDGGAHLVYSKQAGLPRNRFSRHSQNLGQFRR